MHFSIGIDVSKEKIDLGWIRDLATNKKKTKVFKNKQEVFVQIEHWILKQTQATASSEVLITMEPTGVYHEALAYYLHDQGFTIFMANPGRAKQHAQSIGLIHKTDKSDAIALSRYGAVIEQLEPWQPEAKEVRELKALMRRLEALEKDRQRELNRLEACKSGDSSERVLASLADMIRALEAEIASLTCDIDDHIDHHPDLKKNHELLKTIDGVGPVVAREMTYLFAAKSFSTAKQVASYTGLIPRLEESGNHKGCSRLSKTGPSRLRAKLYMAAIAAKQHNPDIRSQYERLLLAGKSKMQAIGAAMRKLVQVCFGVVKQQQKFRPQTC